MTLTDSVRNQIKFVQHHADELYKLAENGTNKAHWHAHEIAKGLGAISYILKDMDEGKGT